MPGNARERHNLPGDWLQPVPLNEAPLGSLNGLYLEGADAPVNLLKLTKILDLLSPGGVVVLVYDARVWSRSDLEEVCRGGGFFLRAYRYTRGLPFLSRRRLLVVLQKQVLGETQLPGKDFSIVIPYAEGLFAAVRTRITAWADFIAEMGWQDRSQIVLVNDALMDNDDFHALDGVVHRGLLDVVHHYRGFGDGECVRTGILHSVGRRVLVDETKGSAPPRELLGLLSEMLRDEKNAAAGERAACFVGFAAPETEFGTNADRKLRGPRFRRFRAGWRQSLFRFITGTRAPFSPLRLYPAPSARELARGTSASSILFRLESSLFLRRAGRRIKEVPVDLPPVAKNAPGIKQALWFRLRRPLRYLAHCSGWLAAALLVWIGLARVMAPLLQKQLSKLARLPELAGGLEQAGLAPMALFGWVMIGIEVAVLLLAVWLFARWSRGLWFRRGDDPPRSAGLYFWLRTLALFGLIVIAVPFAASPGTPASMFALARVGILTMLPVFILLVLVWLAAFYRITGRE